MKEYRDLRSGIPSQVFVRDRSGNVWFDTYGENFGRSDVACTNCHSIHGKNQNPEIRPFPTTM